jgi:cytochrome c oxidase subunit 3/cytochrome o ubiquinol oxidase subunit 3
MNASASNTIAPSTPLKPAQVGMLAFLVSEVAFFGTLISAYITFMGRDTSGPTPAVLSLPLVLGTTFCLLASSGTVHLAEKALKKGEQAGFRLWWFATIALGVIFLAGTAYEWHGLIYKEGLTISRNLFGTTYYTLVGFHAFHVTAGVVVMIVFLGLALKGQITPHNEISVGVVSWYWHFVDVVWIVVFTLVYLIGR